ncbi:Uncharacterized protein dnm_078650 [Desulfonema magnum]|uniref:Uncharacterized protein n=1 Tax=Desulfonema magnum TaxID=45655 RepID=A0A975BU40_9BACT|nr:Uncharacterized protein dnm_078650 [Desulfonema magnum]
MNIPVRNSVSTSSIRKFMKFKKDVLKQIYKNSIEHHA